MDAIKLIAEVRALLHGMKGIWQYMHLLFAVGCARQDAGKSGRKISLRILFRSNSDAIYGIRTCLDHRLATNCQKCTLMIY